MQHSCENKPGRLKDMFRLRSIWKPLLGILIGAVVGFLYYRYYGCTSGTCRITSDPYSSTIFGSMIGLLIVSRPCSAC